MTTEETELMEAVDEQLSFLGIKLTHCVSTPSRGKGSRAGVGIGFEVNGTNLSIGIFRDSSAPMRENAHKLSGYAEKLFLINMRRI